MRRLLWLLLFMLLLAFLLPAVLLLIGVGAFTFILAAILAPIWFPIMLIIAGALLIIIGILALILPK